MGRFSGRKRSLVLLTVAALAALSFLAGVAPALAQSPTAASPAPPAATAAPAGTTSVPVAGTGVDARPDYRAFPRIGSRAAIWIVAQVMLLFAAFVLAVPMFAGIVELVGWRTGDMRYDQLARELTKLLLIAFSTTAALGGTLTLFLFVLYPKFTNYLANVFTPTLLVFPLLFFGEAFSLYLYWYSWDRLMDRKPLHLLLNLALNLFGTALMVIANAWTTFMISPAGVEPKTGALVSLRAAFQNPTWMPLNIHRLIANAAFGGAIVGAYAAFKFLTARSDEERAHYDWMGYVGNFIAVVCLLPLPFAGYWFAREIYSFNTAMGVTMMGGFLSWLWILQALLIGILFLTANYYLWIGLGRMEGGERYARYAPWLLGILSVGFLVWATPHTLVVTPGEQAELGGAHHPLLGFFGVMSAKNTAVNIMILTTFLSFLFYRRGNKAEPPPFDARSGRALVGPLIGAAIGIMVMLPSLRRILAGGLADSPPTSASPLALTIAGEPTRMFIIGLHVVAMLMGVVLLARNRGKLGEGLIFATAALVVVYFGVIGYMVSAIVRIGFSIHQVLAVLSTLISVTAIDIALYRGARSYGRIRWGDMPVRAQYALILLALTFSWTMGLMGFARNGIRQYWHVYEIMRDTSPDAFTPPLGYAANIITICVLVFWALIAFIFWIGDLGSRKTSHATSPAPSGVPAAGMAPAHPRLKH